MNDLDDARVSRAEQIFDLVVDLPPDERAAVLEQRCGDDGELRAFVERLLRLDVSASGEFEQRLPYQPASDDREVRGPQPPFRIGRYMVLRTLGEGGMGTVYEAEQDHPQRIVALKLMMRGICSRSALRRFEHEAQILARLRHPGIAHVYDIGVHEEESKGSRQEGIKASRDEDAEPLDASMPRSLDAHSVPYFVMEYIPSAKPITEYARMKNLGTRERLELFIRVCDAVHHGHQKGIIHRDLKPGNILIDASGQPKVIDFGVARATDSDMAVTTMQTDVGQLIGTLQYMSPEQSDADPHDLDVRSDVYALGVVLYDLLTNQLPYDVAAHPVYEAARVIRETTPPRPSTLNRTLRGDLETITLKALEKDRERRYQSVVDLSEDIRRYLSNRSILARPPSAMYQFRTFARRNKALVGGAAATFIALVAGLVGVSAMYVQAEHLRASEAEQRRVAEQREQHASAEAERAEQALRRATAARQFLTSMLTAVRPQVARGHDTTILRDILNHATERVDNELINDRIVAGDVLHVIGVTYRHIGEYAEAERLLKQALAARREALGNEHEDTLNSINSLAVLLNAQGKFEQAEPLYREAYETSKRVLSDEHTYAIGAIVAMGGLLERQRRLEEAERYYRMALERRQRLHGDDHPDTIRSMVAIANCLYKQGRFGEAETLLSASLERRRRIYGDDHPDTISALNNLALVHMEQGQLEEAQPLFEEVLVGSRRLHGDEHPNTLTVFNNMAFVLERQGKLAEAEPYFRKFLHGRRRIHGNENPYTLIAINNLAGLLRERGRLEEAERLGSEAAQASRVAFPTGHWRIAMFHAQHGATLAAMKRFDEAESQLLQAHAIYQSLGDEQRQRAVVISMHLANLYDAWHEAEPDAGYDLKAAEWREKHAQLQQHSDTSTVPSSATP